MKEIKLTGGQIVLVDDDDYERLNRWRWRARNVPRSIYARREEKVNGVYVEIVMHRLIMNAPPDRHVDHIDGNGLNNQKANLRLCSIRENSWNKRKKINSSSPYKGVTKRVRKLMDGEFTHYECYIGTNGKARSLGDFISEISAAEAYDIAAIQQYGEFAWLNFPEKKDEYLRKLEEKAVSVG